MYQYFGHGLHQYVAILDTYIYAHMQELSRDRVVCSVCELMYRCVVCVAEKGPAVPPTLSGPLCLGPWEPGRLLFCTIVLLN